jgi:hypothetical protein
MNCSVRAWLLFLVLGISSCVDEEERSVTSVIPGKPNEYVSIRVFNSGFLDARQVIVVKRYATNGMFSTPTVSHIGTLNYQNPGLQDGATKLLKDFSFHWQNPDSLIIHSSYLGNTFFIVSRNQLGSL